MKQKLLTISIAWLFCFIAMSIVFFIFMILFPACLELAVGGACVWVWGVVGL